MFAAAMDTAGPPRVSIPLGMADTVGLPRGGGPKPTPPKDVSTAPAFMLRHTIGAGGNGEVWLALQTSLGREVAVKRVKPDTVNTGTSSTGPVQELRYRFAQEARTTALLEHPNIVPVHDFGYDADGMPLMAMKHIKGTPWDQMIYQEHPRMAAEEFLGRHLPVLLAVAQATAFAHDRGIIHRDLKPAQVIVGEFGEVTLMDWGLALALDPELPGLDAGGADALHLPKLATRENATNPAGTPAYMAPEQTEYSTDGLGTWTDVYLLGAILYNLLTATPPHRGDSAASAMMRARISLMDPPSIRAPGREHPAELEALCMRCLNPRAGGRPQTALEFVQSLQSYLTGASRQREASALLDAAATMLGRPGDNYTTLTSALADAERALGIWPALAGGRELRERLLERYARLAIDNGDLVLAQAQVSQLREKGKQTELESMVADALAAAAANRRQRLVAIVSSVVLLVLALLLGTVATLRAAEAAEQRDRAMREAARADSESKRASLNAEKAEQRRSVAELEHYIATLHFAQSAIDRGRYTAAEDALLKVPEGLPDWEWGWLAHACHRELLTFRGHSDTVSDAIFLGGSARVATASYDGTARLWNAVTGEAEQELVGHDGPLVAIEADATETMLLTASRDGTARLWDTATGQHLFTLAHPGGSELMNARFDERGSRVVTASQDRTAIVWDTSTGRALRTLGSHEGIVSDARFIPGTPWVLTSCFDFKARLWNWETGELRATMVGNGSAMRSMAYSPESGLVATGVSSGVVRLWDGTTGQLTQRLRGYGSTVSGLAFSPDGSLLAAAVGSREALVWNARNGRLLHTLSGHLGYLNRVAFSSDHNTLVTSSRDATARLWNVRDGQLAGILAGHSDQVWKAVFSADGRYVVTASADGTAKLWLVRDPVTRRLSGHASAIRQVSVSPDGRTAVTGSNDQTIRLWDVATGQERFVYAGHKQRVYRAVFSPDGTRILTGSVDGSSALLEAATGAELARFMAPVSRNDMKAANHILAAALHPGGSKAVLGFSDGRAWTIDLASGSVLEEIDAGNSDVRDAVYSPDGALLALALGSGDVRLYDDGLALPLHVLIGHRSASLTVAFSPDGKLLASGSSDDTIRLWNPRSGQAAGILRGHADDVRSVCFSNDGTRIVSTSGDGSIRLWHVGTQRELLALDDPDGGAWDATFLPDGKTLLSSGEKGSLTLWPSAPWQRVHPPDGDIPTWEEHLRQWIASRLQHDLRHDPARFIEPEALRLLPLLDAPTSASADLALKRLATLAPALPRGGPGARDIEEALASIVARLQPLAHANASARVAQLAGDPAVFGPAKKALREQAMTAYSPLAAWLLERRLSSPRAALMAMDAYDAAVHHWLMRRLPTHDSAIILHHLAGILHALGFSDDAVICQRRAVAAAYLTLPRNPDPSERVFGIVPETFLHEVENRMLELGGALPPRPPADLVFGANSTETNWLPGWLTTRTWEAADKAQQAVLEERIGRETGAWLEAVAPLPGFDTLRERMIILEREGRERDGATEETALPETLDILLLPLLKAILANDPRTAEAGQALLSRNNRVDLRLAP